MRVFAYNALMIYRDLVCFNGILSFTLFNENVLLLFYYNGKYMKQNLTRKYKHVIRVKCAAFDVQMTIREMCFIYKYFSPIITNSSIF